MAIYRISNLTSGAPTLVGGAGSVIAILDFCLVTKMGWSKAFSGTNLATYRAPTGNRFYLAVDDTSSTGSVRFRGFETATAAGVAVASGIGPFPTDTQCSGGLYTYVGAASAKSWELYSNGSLFHLFTYGGSSTTDIFTFGDFVSYRGGDAYGTLIRGQTTLGSNVAVSLTSGYSGLSIGAYVARAYTGIGSSLNVGILCDTALLTASTQMGGSNLPYPNPITGAIHLIPLTISEPGVGARGVLPGLWNSLQTLPLADRDTFTGSGTSAGRAFELRFIYMGGYSYKAVMETSDTWGT